MNTTINKIKIIRSNLFGFTAASFKSLQDKWRLTQAHPAMRSVGYRQAILYLNGEINYDDFVSSAIAASRQLAKRQMTWLRSWPDGDFLVAESRTLYTETIAIISKILDNMASNHNDI
jgi:tRNA dimethylallyltransferase